MSVLHNALTLSHQYIKKAVAAGDTVADATCGNGHDTLFLSSLVGKQGHVYAFDIQQKAIDSTRARLAAEAEYDNVSLILDGHEHMEKYVDSELAAVMFNLGYLPGGDHAKATKKETDIRAINAASRLLKRGGLITLCVYSGGDTGFEERDAVMSCCCAFDPKYFTVLTHEFINQPNHPPMLICIEKK